MKKVLITMILSIIGYINVYADNFQIYTGYPNETEEYLANINTNYYSTMKVSGINKGTIYNCNSNDTCTGATNYNISTGGIVWQGTMANNGFDIAHDTLEMIASNHMYSYSYTFCVPSGVTDWNNRIYIGTGLGETRINQQNLLRFDYYKADNIEWLHYEQSGANVVDTTQCYTMYNLFNYTGGNANTIKVNLKTSSFTNRYIGFISYKLEDLGATNGLTSGQVQSIINNSGLASASSINQVQNSINNVQNQLNGVNDSIQDQIDADAQNTQDIIDNQNANSQAQIESQQVCEEKTLTTNDIVISSRYLSNNGSLVTSNSGLWGVTEYISVKNVKVLENVINDTIFSCFYNSDKVLLSCVDVKSSGNLTLPSGTSYGRFSIRSNNVPVYQITTCKNGNQALMDADTNYNTNASENIQGKDKVDEMTHAEDNLMDNIDLSGANELNISINPNSSNFIWDIVNRLRNMNLGIITLFTSILGLGIVKMILNR